MRGTIQHRPDRPAPWRERYRSLDGRQESNSFDRKIDADRWLRAELAKLDQGQWVDPGRGSIERAEYSQLVIAERPNSVPPKSRPTASAMTESKPGSATPALTHHTRTAPPLDGGTHHIRLRPATVARTIAATICGPGLAQDPPGLSL